MAPPGEGVPARAAVFVTPGFGEHIGRYAEVARQWSQAGCLVALHDPRGQGRSDGRRGHVASFGDFVDDVVALLTTLRTDERWRRASPPILFGHSLGGLISCHVALRAPQQVRALALSSPYFGRALRVSRLRIWAGRAVGRVWPTYSDRTGLVGTQLTHDVERAHAVDEDPLGVSRITARWFVEVEAAQSKLEVEAATIQLPVFCQAAGDDSVADLEATRRLMSKLGGSAKQLWVRDGAYHDLHQEVERSEYMAAFATWFGGLASTASDDGEGER